MSVVPPPGGASLAVSVGVLVGLFGMVYLLADTHPYMAVACLLVALAKAFRA